MHQSCSSDRPYLTSPDEFAKESSAAPSSAGLLVYLDLDAIEINFTLHHPIAPPAGGATDSNSGRLIWMQPVSVGFRFDSGGSRTEYYTPLSCPTRERRKQITVWTLSTKKHHLVEHSSQACREIDDVTFAHREDRLEHLSHLLPRLHLSDDNFHQDRP